MCNKSGLTVAFLLITHCGDDSEWSPVILGVYGSQEDADKVVKEKKEWLKYVEGMSGAVSNLMQLWAEANPLPQEGYAYDPYSQIHAVNNNHPAVFQREKDRLAHLHQLEELSGLDRVRQELLGGRMDYQLSEVWWDVVKVPFYPSK